MLWPFSVKWSNLYKYIFNLDKYIFQCGQMPFQYGQIHFQPGQILYKVIRSVKSTRPSLNEELDSENGPWPWDKDLKCAASPKKLVLGDISQGHQPRLGDHGRWWGGQQWRGLLQLSCGLKINDDDSVSTKKLGPRITMDLLFLKNICLSIHDSWNRKCWIQYDY